MPDKTKKSIRKSRGWSAARRHLTNLDKPALLALLKDLYDSSAENRDFIQARCQATDSGVLETYRKRIIEQFYSKRADGIGPLKLGVVRKAIRDYRKATGNLSGTAELLMTFVETGTEFTRDYGDMDEAFYSSVESALLELSGLLRSEAECCYQQFSERLATVTEDSEGIGWGFHDFVVDVIWQLKDDLAEP